MLYLCSWFIVLERSVRLVVDVHFRQSFVSLCSSLILFLHVGLYDLYVHHVLVCYVLKLLYAIVHVLKCYLFQSSSSLPL